MTSWLHDMYLWLGFSPKAAKFLFREQGLDSHERLRLLTDKNVSDVCNVVKTQDGKNANEISKREQQVLVGPRKPEASCLPIPL